MAVASGVDLHGNMKRKVPDRVVLAEVWSLTRGLRCTVSLIHGIGRLKNNGCFFLFSGTAVEL